MVDFWSIFGGFGTDFWTIFRLTLENYDFMKNRVSPWKNQYFLKFGVPKIYKKIYEKSIEKQSEIDI